MSCTVVAMLVFHKTRGRYSDSPPWNQSYMPVIKSIIMLIVYIYTKDKSRLVTACLTESCLFKMCIKEINNVILMRAFISFIYYLIISQVCNGNCFVVLQQRPIQAFLLVQNTTICRVQWYNRNNPLNSTNCCVIYSNERVFTPSLLRYLLR